MNTLIFATGNKNKITEINEIFIRTYPDMEIVIKGLDVLNFKEEIPETTDTISGNAIQKATYIHERFKVNCFAEDTGLEIAFLEGKPGVHSARYAGEQRSDDDNIDMVLDQMSGTEDRTARFKTVIALIYSGETYLFEGICNGTISRERRGKGGFGYDPIFIPDGYKLSFGQMPTIEKNKISHRNKALQKMLSFFKDKILVR
ncbi:MAG: RdgB/HAM1 family non-canonical purine NTP pyrophosphatase [Saprospiraceae bacterium]|nr:RdgB/HAM1 family non-canonical purine NTP pyrophosphatase [Saprospiraceae bacterium]